jgi:hypothetical protein
MKLSYSTQVVTDPNVLSVLAYLRAHGANVP